MCEIYAVCAFKGGVGKTTSSTNLAAALKKLKPEANILLVDLDFQANATMAFGYMPDELNNTIYEAIHREVPIESVMLHHETGVDIIPSSFDVSVFDLDLFRNESGLFPEDKKPFILKELLEPLKVKYDYMIIDTGPSLSMLAVNYMVMADHFLVALQMGRFALAGAVKLIDYIADVRKSYCPGETYRTDLFATFFDARTNISTDVMQEARRYCSENGMSIADTTISKTIRFENSQAYNCVPLVFVENSNYTQEYINLTKELIL